MNKKMTKKKIKNEEIEEIILEIIESSSRSLSIAQVRGKLAKEFDIKLSPQIVKKHLLNLQKEGKIE